MAKKATKSKAKGEKKKVIPAKVRRSYKPGLYAALVLSLLVLVFLWCLEPTQNWLRQRREMSRLGQKISHIEEKNKRLEEEKAALNTLERVEGLAREELGMVKPGEEAYVVIPPPKSSRSPEDKIPAKRKPSIWQQIKSYLDKL